MDTSPLVLAQEGLVIDWENLPTYNTIMSVAAGAGLIMVVQLARAVFSGHEYSVEGYALGFAVNGIILVITGAHMTLTWPLAPDFPFDNIIFGEPALGFGVLLLVAAFHGWSHRRTIDASPPTVERLIAAAAPSWPFVLGLGLGCIAIAAAGISNQLFAAPPQEPLTGLGSTHWSESAPRSIPWWSRGAGAQRRCRTGPC
jgi:hypothetical protein